MKNLYSEDVFALENFEGPLDLLLHLIQKHEIDLSEVSIKKITEQYINKLKEMSAPGVDAGAEFIASASFLLWLKSRMLLPRQEQPLSPEEQEHDPRFEIIHQLLDYCRFKDAAKELSDLEMSRSSYYRTPDPNMEINRINLGIEHLTIDDLAGLFKNALAKASVETRLIEEEEWRVADMIKAIRLLFRDSKRVDVSLLFAPGKSKAELIVTFLAILELMKIGDIQLVKEVSTQKMFLCGE